MTFQELLRGVETLSSCGDAEVAGLEYDSRRVRNNDVFVAMRGESTDGNRYIDAAIKAGAAAVVTDSAVQEPRPGVAWASVAHGRRALAALSSNLFRSPGRNLKLTGITGTNGKTTTTFLLEAMLQGAGRSCALIGTVEYHIGGRTLPAPHTTPESLELNQMFAQALQAGATEAVMEVSSHALEQGRVWGLPYDVAVFTNLTRDHLDYHHSMEQYFSAKSALFEGAGADPPRVNVINSDDEYGHKLAARLRGDGRGVMTYGIGGDADLRAEKVEYSHLGTSFRVQGPFGSAAWQSRLIGEINVYNALAAAGAALARGVSAGQIAATLAAFESVPGRFQRVPGTQPFSVVVDYAHTDDALRNLTRIARQLVTAQGGGRVITLFGCGGDRDRAKRPLMGKAAGEGSDFVVLTSDNPRSEDPLAIIGDARPGLEGSKTPFVIEADRALAIRMAIREARPGDIVLLAGKGHEKTQTTRNGTIPFDDVEVARATLAESGFGESARTAPQGAPAA